jgi:predicted membrane-bound spermidine synthase
MDRDQLDRRIDEFELELLGDDPSLAKRWKALERGSTFNVIAVFLLLAMSAVLLAAGLATQSVVAWSAGLTAFVLSFGADHTYRRVLAKTPAP